jgi:hypothetical protein
MAARMGHAIVTDSTKETASIALGCFDGASYRHQKPNHEISKDLKAHRIWQENYGDCKETDSVSVHLESTLDYQLCDNIQYNDILLCVSQKNVRIAEGVLIFSYRLQLKTAIRQSLAYNDKIKGAAIYGKVLAIEADRMKLHLEIDEKQAVGEAYPYQYNAEYTTEGSTGVYCMPQIGDRVILYLPTFFEENAYIKDASRVDGNPKTTDPAIKYWGNNYGKEIKLAPGQLKFYTNENKIYVDMSDSDGVKLQSNSVIQVNSANEITLDAANIRLKAGEEILVRTANSNIIVNKTVDMKAVGGVRA